MDSEIQKQFEELYVRIHVVELLITSALSGLVPSICPATQMASFLGVDIFQGNSFSPQCFM